MKCQRAVGYGNNAGGVAASSAFGFQQCCFEVDYASAFGYSNMGETTARRPVQLVSGIKLTSENASAVGYGNNANALAASAVGYNNTAGGVGLSTIGYNNTATNRKCQCFLVAVLILPGAGVNAFGFSNTASGDNANKHSYNNIASGSKTMFSGTEILFPACSSTAVGTTNGRENSTTIGNNNTRSAPVQKIRRRWK